MKVGDNTLLPRRQFDPPPPPKIWVTGAAALQLSAAQQASIRLKGRDGAKRRQRRECNAATVGRSQWGEVDTVGKEDGKTQQRQLVGRSEERRTRKRGERTELKHD